MCYKYNLTLEINNFYVYIIYEVIKQRENIYCDSEFRSRALIRQFN